MKTVMKLLAITALAGALIQPEAVGALDALHRIQQQKIVANDVPIGANPDVDEFNPSVAANPVQMNYLVAGSQYYTEDPNPGDTGEGRKTCVVYTSSDGGQTWTEPQPMPMLSDTSDCQYPVIAYAPDGSRVYYAYTDIKATVESTELTFTRTSDWDILVSTSEDNGVTWSAPVVALDGAPSFSIYEETAGEYVEFQDGFDYVHPWISTPVDPAESDWVYVTATLNERLAEDYGDPLIMFASSSDGGTTWGEPVMMDEGHREFTTTILVDDSRPAGGLGGDVLVAWYYVGLAFNTVEIRTRYSSDHGATWNEIVIAAADTYLITFAARDPNPDVEIDGQGGAHIVYTNDPGQDQENGENGDIRYIESNAAPYLDWSAPITVNTDGLTRTQSWATVDTQMVDTNIYVYVMWADFRFTRKGSATPPNPMEVLYDIFYVWKLADSPQWSPNLRVTDVSSMAEERTFGDYIDLTANSNLVYGVWTDRRNSTDMRDPESDVYGELLTRNTGIKAR